MNIIPIKRALLSVANKTGIVSFAQELINLGVAIISTGGTSQLLHESGVAHRRIEEITGLPEMFDGRVKTLHPKVHGGILGKRDVHAAEAEQYGIEWVDLLAINFYPFSEIVDNQNTRFEQAVEYIDIGGPTMARAAAKNFEWVAAIVDPNDYSTIIAELIKQQGITFTTRKHLAEKVFALTSSYDSMIYNYFLEKPQEESSPQDLNLFLEKHSELRYGENPHQKAFAYHFKQKKTGVLSAHQYQGKPLSYNNILDTESALACVSEFTLPTCAIIKHANPCGVAQAANIDEACRKAQLADSLSAFGGIVALNRQCTKTIAELVTSIFTEVIIAPSFTEEALAILAGKPNLRVLKMPSQSNHFWEMKFIEGGVLLQEKDRQELRPYDLKIVTRAKPTQQDLDGMLFAWPVLKHIKSNGILIAKNNATVGIGTGQVSRIDAVNIAIQKAGKEIKDCILASDAFFPFRDSIDHIAKAGIRAIIQPGGSQRDDEVIAACDDFGIAMVFAGKRCFKH